ncbi:oxidoreductase [Candidatus Atribacteria bacterium HGW-Atribacteria-1]|nr:MAG: oxidoreductase [Candidatus Atribacteria bacterium HGW-Atribacteria-1]
MTKKQLRIGVIGHGFMGKAHSNAYRQVIPFFQPEIEPVLQVICGRNEEKVEAFAKTWSYKSTEYDWRKVIERDDIDAIDVCVPGYLHKDIVVAAAEAGKWVLCEKPLAMNQQEAEKMTKAVEKAGVPNTVFYNYRRIPAVTMMHDYLKDGKLGNVYHVRTVFLQDFTMSPDMEMGGGNWRLDVKKAGSGVLGDLVAHNVDAAMWLNGPITSVVSCQETFIKERKSADTGKMEKVGIDDATLLLCRYANGAIGYVEATRHARGHKAEFIIEVNADKASMIWNLHDLHRLQYFDYTNPDKSLRGWVNLHVTQFENPYMDKWWVPGLQIGYEHSFVHHIADFLECAARGESARPTIRDAWQTQKVCDAVVASNKDGKWHDTGVEWKEIKK